MPARRKQSGRKQAAKKSPAKKQAAKKPALKEQVRPHWLALASTEFTGQAILTVVPGKQTDLLDAGALGQQMKDQGRIFDSRPAGSPGGLSIILNPDTSSDERIAIADEFIALGYQVIERPG